MDNREEWIARTFVELASLVSDESRRGHIWTTLADRCSELLDPADVGVLLLDGQGGLVPAGASAPQLQALLRQDATTGGGPGSDCFRSGNPVEARAIDEISDRWPGLGVLARERGYVLVHALPMGRGDRLTGALTIYRSRSGPISRSDVIVVQAFAECTALTLLQEEVTARATAVARQLQTALSVRIPIEQAKGIVAEHFGISIDEAFMYIRAYARRHGRRVADVAQAMVSGELSPDRVHSTRPR